MKKLLSLVLALCMVLGCTSALAADKYEIGILQLVQHEALDAATQGFMDALTEKLGADNVEFDLQNASGDTAACNTIATTFDANAVDLIMANATPALLAASNASIAIPVLGTSVTDYSDAFAGEIPSNVSGTSDLAPLDTQAAIVKELFPEAKKVGLLFCSAEPNSVFQVNAITVYLKELGYETEEFAFADSNDVASVAQSAADNCDVIYIPTDNTAASYAETIANVLIPANIPAVVGESGICKGCGVATLSISYYDLGWQTGLMAYDILVNGADIANMDICYAPNPVKLYNADICAQLGLTMPADYQPIQ